RTARLELIVEFLPPAPQAQLLPLPAGQQALRPLLAAVAERQRGRDPQQLQLAIGPFPLQLMEFFGPSLSVGGALLMLLIPSLLTLSRAAQPFFHLRQGDAAGELVLLLLYPQYLAQPQLPLDLSSPRLGA